MKTLLIEDNLFVCQECNRKFNDTRSLGVHISRKHNQLNYFNDHLAEELDGKCTICNESTTFNSAIKGYRKTCSDECKNKLTSNIAKENNYFSKDYWKSQGLTDEEINLKFKQKSIWSKEYWKNKKDDDPTDSVKKAQSENGKKYQAKVKDNPAAYIDKFSTRLEYWLTKYDGDYNKALSAYKERQNTFTLEKCILKYGVEQGNNIWQERQAKWSNLIETKYRNGEFTKFCKHNSSNAELKFIEHLIEQANPQDTYYCALNGNRQFFRYFSETKKTYAYDFVIGKKIIEFNGDYWHCNPSKCKSTDYHTVMNMTAKEKWKLDEIKLNLIKDAGYEVLVIWESDYKNNPETIINQCIEYLNT
jgi:G:T-mismatch repair DNA endonuclease (very short patch repair protein)